MTTHSIVVHHPSFRVLVGTPGENIWVSLSVLDKKGVTESAARGVSRRDYRECWGREAAV